jgi:hypothetical protein
LRGAYRFSSIPPGDYRILSTFDDPDTMDAARPIHIDPQTDPQLNLDVPAQ